MATSHLPSQVSRQAKTPFVFNSASHLMKIGTERATNLGELLEAMRHCPEASIFQHTFQTLQEHHYIREGFSNDFAHWAFAACNETGLAEQLAGVDVREFTSIRGLREKLVKILEEHLQKNPRSKDRAALEAFYFCSSENVVVPTTMVARDLAEFTEGVRRVGLHSIHFHFINARLRLKLQSNDFSEWLKDELGMPELAGRVNNIDIYTDTLEGSRRNMVKILEAAVAKQ